MKGRRADEVHTAWPTSSAFDLQLIVLAWFRELILPWGWGRTPTSPASFSCTAPYSDGVGGTELPGGRSSSQAQGKC